jgi:hypothetical protein
MEPYLYMTFAALGGLLLGYLLWGPQRDDPIVTPPDESPAPVDKRLREILVGLRPLPMSEAEIDDLCRRAAEK